MDREFQRLESGLDQILREEKDFSRRRTMALQFLDRYFKDLVEQGAIDYKSNRANAKPPIPDRKLDELVYLGQIDEPRSITMGVLDLFAEYNVLIRVCNAQKITEAHNLDKVEVFGNWRELAQGDLDRLYGSPKYRLSHTYCGVCLPIYLNSI